jgi:hypothetical protein
MRQARSGSRGFSTPATFHPQGLATLSMVCSLAGPVDFFSRRQRLWGLTLRSFLLPDGHMAFLPCSPRVSLPRIRARRSKPTRANPEPDYQVLPPSSPLRREKCLALRAAGDSLGLCPFQGDSTCRLEQVSTTRLLSRAYQRKIVTDPASLRRRVSIGDQLARPIGLGTPLRVLAHHQSWHWTSETFGLFCSPCEAKNVTVDRDSRCEGRVAYRSCQDC